MVLPILGAIGAELASNLAFGGLDQIGAKKPKDFGQILGETLSDPINFIPFGGLVSGLFKNKKS